MTSQNIDYTRLLELIPSYFERTDTAFEEYLPTAITLAENRVATDCKQQGFRSVVTGTLPGDGVLAKPAWWRETIGFHYTDASGQTVFLKLRDYQYLRSLYPDAAATGETRFYADYDFEHFFIAPPPSDAGLEFELTYFARLDPLSESNTSNWLTINAPQILLYACCLEAAMFVKNQEAIARWTMAYTDAKSSIQGENQERLADGAEVVSRA